MKKPLVILASILFLLGSLPYDTGIPTSSGERGEEITIKYGEILTVRPGESRALFYNGSTSEFAPIALPDVCAGLPENVSEAVAKVPLWLRRDLSNKFGELSEVNLDVGSRCTPAFADLDGDGDMDLTVGGEDDLRYFENVGNRIMPIWLENTSMYSSVASGLGTRNTPAFADMDGDGDFDLTLGFDDGTLSYFENNGTTEEPGWEEDGSMYQGITVGSHSNPALADMDHDGDPDLTIGSAYNVLYYFVNDDGTWTPHPVMYETMGLTGYLAPALCDLNDDGDFDLILGDGDGTIHYYRDTGTSGHNWVEDLTLFADGERGIKVESYASPALADLDGDHCFDLMVGEGDGEAMYFKNFGRAQNPGFVDLSSGMVYEYDNQALVGVTVPRSVTVPTRKVMVRADIERADAYARLILEADGKFADEIGFSIAHTVTSVLRNGDVYPRVFRENAELIYQIDPKLDYVDLVERTSPEGRYTTTTYWVNETGNLSQYELPKEYYYWYIVHPKITDEIPTYINPQTGNPATPEDGGRFWREYLFYHNDTAYPSDPGGGVCYPKDEPPPLLKEKLEGVRTLWNCTSHRSPGGYDNDGHNNQRPWDYGDHALEKLSNWVCKTLPLNAQEDSDGRTIQPVRIAYEHNGNCGELQDLSTSAGRTCLIPSQGVCDIAEDHVYQEFWDRGWHHWDNWWSDGGTGIERSLMYDGHWYDVSVVWAHRGDDYIRNVNHRPYTPTGTLKLTILDRFGEPVDGAFIVANSHFIAKDITGVPFAPPPIPCFWNYTDTNGECLLKLGMNDYTINIWSRLGSVPDQQISIEEGQEYSRTFSVDGRKPTHDIQPSDQGAISGDSDTLRFDFKVLEGTQEQVNLFQGTRHPQPVFMNRDIDFFICDEENYISYLKGYTFDCHDLEENVVEGTVEVNVPKDTDWYFVFSNTEPLQTGKKIEISMETTEVNKRPEVKITKPVEDEEINGSYEIRGTASDVNGDEQVQKVEIRMDEEGWKEAEGTIFWSYDWDTTELEDGVHTIYARAYDGEEYSDTAGVDITVRNEGTGNHPPVIGITGPENGSTVEGTIPIEGTAEDEDGNEQIRKVEIRIDDGGWGEAETEEAHGTTSWSFEWDTTEIGDGEHTIHARAYDGEDYSEVEGIDVTVDNQEPVNHDPTIEITSVEKTDDYTLQIQWQAADPDGDTLTISLHRDSDTNPGNGKTLIAENLDDTGSYDWDISEMEDGDYYILAGVTDGKGGEGSNYSEIFTISLPEFAPDFMVVSLDILPQAPVPGDPVVLQAVVRNQGTASGTGNVEFLVGGVHVKNLTLTLRPGKEETLSASWNAVEGNHTILVRVSVSGDSDAGNNELERIVGVAAGTPEGKGKESDDDFPVVYIGGMIILAALVGSVLVYRKGSPGGVRCPECGDRTTYSEEYDDHYCWECEGYVSRMKDVLDAEMLDD